MNDLKSLSNTLVALFCAGIAATTVVAHAAPTDMTWHLSGHAGGFCRISNLGQPAQASGATVTVQPSADGQSADGVIVLEKFQGPDDRQTAWSTHIVLPVSMCDMAYRVSVTSANGGLLNSSALASKSSAFTNLVDYHVAVELGGDVADSVGAVNGQFNASGAKGLGHAFTSLGNRARGVFVMDLSSLASSSQLLLAGEYRDRLTIVIGAAT